MNTFNAFDAFLGDRSERKLPCTATYAIRLVSGGIELIYHKTVLVTYFPGGCRVATGGYRTVTTKARINEFSPLRIHAVKGEWYTQHGQYVDGEVYREDGAHVPAYVHLASGIYNTFDGSAV